MGLTGVILAGGQSMRMGRDKAWLPIGPHTLIELVIKRLRPHVERVFVIGNARNAGALHTFLRHERRLVEGVLTDLKPGFGPLMGVFTGLMASDTRLNLCVPCDMPWVESRLIERLVLACHEGAEAAAGRHPFDGIQPFPLLCDVKACKTIGALLERGERSLQALLRQPNVSLVTVEEPELWRSFTNVNTAADYARLSDEATLAR